LSNATDILLNSAERVEIAGMLALYRVGARCQSGLRAVTQRVEPIVDPLVKKVGDCGQPMGGIEGIGESRAIRQRRFDQIARRIVCERRSERTAVGDEGAGEQSLARVIGELSLDLVGSKMF
jgi:hypothetical protein